MKKIAMSKVSDILQKVPAVIQGLVAENSQLQEKVAGLEKNARARELAAEMEEKGLDIDHSLQEKIASLASMPDDELDVHERAMKLAAPQTVSGFALEDRAGTTRDPHSAFAAGLFELAGR